MVASVEAVVELSSVVPAVVMNVVVILVDVAVVEAVTLVQVLVQVVIVAVVIVNVLDMVVSGPVVVVVLPSSQLLKQAVGLSNSTWLENNHSQHSRHKIFVHQGQHVL